MITVMTMLLAISTKSRPTLADLLEYLLYIVIAAVIALFITLLCTTEQLLKLDTQWGAGFFIAEVKHSIKNES
jgi:hypothetical protein